MQNESEMRGETMYINEAVEEAIKKDCCIRNPKGDFPNGVIRPTNKPECCIIFEFGKESSPRWNPKAKDLMSDGWELYEG